MGRRSKGPQFLKKGTPEYRRYLIAEYMARLAISYRNAGTIQQLLVNEHGIEVNAGTVEEDMTAIRTEWKNARIANIEEIIGGELARLDTLQREVEEAWQESKRDKTDITTTEEAVFVSIGTDSVPAKLVKTVKRRYAKDPDPRYAIALLGIQEARRKLLLGSSKYIKDNVNVGGDGKTVIVTLRIGNRVIEAPGNKPKELPAEIEELN
jgi:hypothetical protein